MSAEQLTQVVREQLRLGRLLPLGTEQDSLWIAELAAADMLRTGAAGVVGVRLDGVRLTLADPDGAPWAAADPVSPPSALPRGPLRIRAECAAALDGPLTERTEPLRAALAETARDRIGLTVTAVDLRVTDVLEEQEGTALDPDASDFRPQAGPPPALPRGEIAAAVARAVLAVRGVSGLGGVPGGTRAVSVEDGETPEQRLVRLQLTVDGRTRALTAAREARRAAVAETGSERVSVLVTGVAAGAE